MINYFNIPVEFLQLYQSITLMFKGYFLRYNTIYLMIVDHKTLSCKTQLLCCYQFHVPLFSVTLLCLFSYTLSTIYIYISHKTLISHHGCSYYQVITGQKEQTIFCITFLHSPSDASFQQITFLEYTILQFFLHNNSVTLQHKQSTKSLLCNFNFLNDYTKVKRNNIRSSNQK